MPSSATVTSKTGAGQTVTSLALTGITRIEILPSPISVIKIMCDQGPKEFDIEATTTFTVTASSGDLTITISQ